MCLTGLFFQKHEADSSFVCLNKSIQYFFGLQTGMPLAFNSVIWSLEERGKLKILPVDLSASGPVEKDNTAAVACCQ